MKSPIRENNRFKCLPLLRELIPPGSVINSFLFFDGNLEFGLANSERFIIGHTNRYVVYEFWECATTDARKTAEISSLNRKRLRGVNEYGKG